MIPGRANRAAWLLALFGLAGCAVTPTPLTETERSQAAVAARERLFANQEALTAPLTLYEATARAIKYQQDYRVRMMEEALALGQLDVAQFDLLPKLTANAGYTARNNESFGYGFTPGGTIATNPSASVERQHSTSNIGLAWNVLDFGVSYYRAKQLADQRLIAEERRRKALQNLVLDVRLAWWRAEAAQRLLPRIDALFTEIDETMEKTRLIENRKLLPPLQTASLRRALLDLQQQLALRRQELAQAQVELAALLNVPPGTPIKIAAPDRMPAANLNLITSAETLETVALRQRPELSEELYKARVSENEAKKAMVSLFPNLILDGGRYTDSNKYLVNNVWYSGGLNVAFNLTKAFSAPAVRRSAEAQKQVDEARQLAMAMAIISQTRIAAVRYTLMQDEHSVWAEAVKDDDQIVSFLSSSTQVGIDTELELIRAKARAMVSHINRDWMYAALEGALGRVYNSVGMDILPDQTGSVSTADLARILQKRIAEWETINLATKQEAVVPAVAIGAITGVPEAASRDFRSAVQSILSNANVTIADEASAPLRLVTGITLEPLRDGGRPITVRTRVVQVSTNALVHAAEFKTTLSEPVDDEQWRVVGEAVGYKVAGPIRKSPAMIKRTTSEMFPGGEDRLMVSTAVAARVSDEADESAPRESVARKASYDLSESVPVPEVPYLAMEGPPVMLRLEFDFNPVTPLIGALTATGATDVPLAR